MYSYMLVLILSTQGGDIVKFHPFHQFNSADQCAASIRPATGQAYMALDGDLKKSALDGSLDLQVICVQGFGL